MTLVDFLRTKTQVMELCVIRDGGWRVADCWIDHADLFYIPSHLRNKIVKKDVVSVIAFGGDLLVAL